MASPLVILAIAALVAFPSVAFAMQWIVGDDRGWTNTYGNYSDWTKDKVFYVGDSLVFNYPVNDHDVFKISNASDFQQCVFPSANQALKSGHDIITLLTPGVKWYACGVANHCADGNQKLKINVLDAGPAAPPPSSSTILVSSGVKILVAAVVALVLM